MENAKADEYFGYTEKGGSFDGEIRAGITTFLTMAYILLVNPAMLTLGIGDGTQAGNEQAFADILFATAVAAFIGCTVMGLWANLPFALAPGMGLNAYFTFGVVLGMGIDWQIALFAVFIEGILFLAMSLPQVGWRTAMINSIPTDLKIATGAGIGMFLSIIGLREMGWIRDDGATLVNIGQTESWGGTVMKGDDSGPAVPCVDTVLNCDLHIYCFCRYSNCCSMGTRSNNFYACINFYCCDDGKGDQGCNDHRYRWCYSLGLGSRRIRPIQRFPCRRCRMGCGNSEMALVLAT